MSAAAYTKLGQFAELWAFDFEFRQADGDRPEPICLVARELRTRRTVRMWQDEINAADRPPYPTDGRSLFIAFNSVAEFNCHLARGWSLPEHTLDLYVEFKWLGCGYERPPGGWSLLGALRHFGIDGIDAEEKKTMRELAMRGGPWTVEERAALIAYCETDVDALENLLPYMLPSIDLPRAIGLRGRYMRALSRMEHAGTPLDAATLMRLRPNWEPIKARLIGAIDVKYGVYDRTRFKTERFAGWLAARDIAWPFLASGSLDLRQDTFRDMAKVCPELAALHELRTTISRMRLSDLAIGTDARNRTPLWAFQSKTSRNQPSNARFIFGPATWLRSLIKPPRGCAIAYLDFEQQEFGIGAALSGDVAMMDAYRTGDPYMAFAILAGAAPTGATKETHESVREKFKQCILGVQYVMGAEALGYRIGQAEVYARELLALHRKLFSGYWRWADAAVDHAMALGWLETVFGWRVRTTASVLHRKGEPYVEVSNPRSMQNFPCQANGAEMLRLGCCFATERGVEVCAPIHDAILITAGEREIDAAVATAKAAMIEASKIVLGGFELRVEVKIVRYPARYVDKRGREMWNTVMRLLDELEPER
jgi:hypothetical protein